MSGILTGKPTFLKFLSGGRVPKTYGNVFFVILRSIFSRKKLGLTVVGKKQHVTWRCWEGGEGRLGFGIQRSGRKFGPKNLQLSRKKRR
jgi:hypothetical protein